MLESKIAAARERVAKAVQVSESASVLDLAVAAMSCGEALELDGWKRADIVRGDRSERNLGILYTKDGREFWLSIKTFRSVPSMLSGKP